VKNMDENDNRFTGDELSDKKDSDDGLFVGDELDENIPEDDQIAGNELNDDGNSGEKGHAQIPPETVASPSISPEKSGSKRASRKWVWGMGALIMIVLMGVGGGFFFNQHRSHAPMADQSFSTVKMPIPPVKEIWLKDFLIPLRFKHLYTCVSLSVVIRTWDKAVLQKQPHEKQWLRGVLYDILHKKIQQEEKTPSLDKFKQWMTIAVKDALPHSQIDTVDIQQFQVF